jgi:hypothetical protein
MTCAEQRSKGLMVQPVLDVLIQNAAKGFCGLPCRPFAAECETQFYGHNLHPNRHLKISNGEGA